MALGALVTGASLLGKFAGNLLGNRAKARTQEAALNAEQDRLGLEKARFDADNARANIETDTRYRNTQFNNAARGGLMAGMQDAKVTAPPGVFVGEVTGGLRPSAIRNRESMGDQLQRDSILRYMQGAGGLHGDSPALTPVPQAGKLDKVLGVASFLGGLAGVADYAHGQYSATPQQVAGALSGLPIGSMSPSELPNNIGTGALDESSIPSDITGSYGTMNNLRRIRQPKFGG